MAIAAVAAAILLRLALGSWLGDRLPYITVFGAVAVAVWYGGAGPALVAAVLGFVAASAWIAAEPNAGSISGPALAIAAIGFGLSSGLIIAFGVAMQRSQDRLRQEIAQRAQVEAELVESGEQLQATLRSIGDGVIVCDRGGKVISLNPVAEQLTGWSVDEALGRPLTEVFDIVNEDTRETVPNPALRAMTSNTIIGLANHTILRGRSGQERAIDDSASPVRGSDGSVRGAVLIFRDVSDVRSKEREARRTTEALAASESVLRAMNEGSSLCMGLVELTDDGDILHLQDNAAACRIFGVPPGGTANRRASELGAASAMIHLWLEKYRQSAEQQGPVTFEFELQVPEGLQRHRATVSPLPHVDGQRERFTYVTEDISARHAVELVIRQSAANARLALEVAEIGTWSWDPTRDIFEADVRCRRIYGFPVGVALQLRDVLLRIPPGDRAMVEERLAALTEHGGADTFHAEFRFVHSDSNVRWVIARGQMLDDGKDEGDQRQRRLVLGTAFDVTQRKQQEEALVLSDRRKSEFIATLAHELRNPLAPMRNSVAVMRLSKPDDVAARSRSLDMLDRQLDLMVRMVDDLLDVSRIDNGLLELRREPLELADIVRESVEISQPLLALHRHSLSIDLPPQRVTVLGDSARLTQVLCNLLTNAAKYTPDGGGVRVELLSDNVHARLIVCDDGIGIPSDMHDRVFDMFAQVDRSTPAASSGLGIGLAISRRLMQLHGGTLSVESKGEGHGSCFVMQLPCIAPAESPRALPRIASGATNNGARVLVVDDNVDAASSLAVALELMGHEASAAFDAAMALDIAARKQPDFILLDLGMPGTNGFELAPRLREVCGGVPIVALTGWGQASDRAKTAAAGFDHHLVKPVDPTTVHQMIVKLARR